MDSQFRRGILDACVLAVLEKGESYGYQLVKDISQFITITESTLYPILKRLEQTAMLEVFSQEHNGRLRKYYRITPAGRDRITELLNEWEEIVKVYQFIVTERGESHEQSGISFGTESGA
ncbi:MAG: PadR family transcriptional regulator [Lachnospiraceae bacterium]|nr:PadR family transcriptional regulator [Lachnospiraceae bacterium]MBO4559219.1 PadR family transcriptional regulator [Lachnospiraceae bacterium]MBR5733861.1 PadR family transcriptional regulator [Lachnospiraceae bacterium]MBR5968390.1 PadR family transcriptional regulator [Lachnospiraceae bacterium]